MPTQQIPLGTLNRLVASVTFTEATFLNVTPPYLTRRAIRFTPDMDMTTFINVLTGMVTSPEPYIGVTVTINLNRSLPLASSWQTRFLTNTLLGKCTVRPDVAARDGGLQPFDLDNCGIQRLGDLGMDGEDPVMPISLRGTLYINSLIWAA
jgi:hypothetical protein